ncbi:helix-turn-helix domain-containing protein [Viridibacillus arvi]|uniref:helix-turn-helix domain-containing protein n=1 Tax=Viridibacillus arvi TaxID=263475 RepID=UPI003CFBC991
MLKEALTDVGPLIKLYRIKSGLTQEELSEGICTPSYLSRIENSHVIADIEIHQLLFQRMNIDFNDFYEESINMDSKLESIYMNLLSNKTPNDENDENYKLLEDSTKYIFKKELHLKAKLVFSRYLISLKRYKEAKVIIDEIGEVIQLSGDRNTFIYINVAISLYYLTNQQKKANELSKQAATIRDFLDNGSSFELGCYYYNLALLLCKEYKYLETIEHCQKALNYFTDIYQPNLDFKCHILLGVAKNNLAQYNLAKRHYKICLNILQNIEKLSIPSNFNMVYSNLGYCYDCQGDINKAIYYYTKAFDYSQGISDYINLIRTHYQADNIDSALKYLNTVLLIDEIISPKYQYQIDILSFILLGNLDTQTAENINALEERSLSYFKEEKFHTLTIFYSKLFAQFYKKLNWYKKTSELLEIALEISESLRKGGEVE